MSMRTRSSLAVLVLFALAAVASGEIPASDEGPIPAAYEMQKAQKKAPAVIGGRFFFLLDDDSTLTGVIYDIVEEGDKREIVLTNGKRLPLEGCDMINCVSSQTSYPDDEPSIKQNTHSLFLSDGSVEYGEIVDYEGKTANDRGFVLADGRKFPWKKVARIYIR